MSAREAAIRLLASLTLVWALAAAGATYSSLPSTYSSLPSPPAAHATVAEVDPLPAPTVEPIDMSGWHVGPVEPVGSSSTRSRFCIKRVVFAKNGIKTYVNHCRTVRR